MSYPTTGYPEWRTLSPKIHDRDDTPEFVETAARIAKQVFGQNVELHRPELDAVSFLKPKVVYAAIALADVEEDGSVRLGDAAEVMGDLAVEAVEERGVGDVEFTAEDLAVIGYALQVPGSEWGFEESSFERKEAWIILNDSYHDLREAGAEVWDRGDSA